MNRVRESEAFPQRSGMVLLGGTLAVGVLSVYLIFLHDRYLPIHEGWFSYYGALMRQGSMPYRDFYFFGQPLPLFISQLFVGDHLINLRRFGLIERIVLAGLLYFLLSRRFSPMASLLATVTSLTFFGTYMSDALFTYLADSLVALVAGMICVHLAYAHSRHERVFLFLAGVCASLSFFSKQTSGFFASVALAILIIWFAGRARRVVRDLAFYSAGWWVVAAPIVWWLLANGAWQAYLTQAYKGAVSSKGGGSLWSALFGFVGHLATPRALVVFVVLCAFAAVVTKWGLVVLRSPGDREPASGPTEIVCTSLIALAALLLPVFVRVRLTGDIDVDVMILRMTALLISRLVFYAMMVALARACVKRLRSHTPASKRVDVIFLVGGGLWALSSGMSYTVEQQAVILGLPFLIAIAYDTIRARAQTAHVQRVVAALCLAAAGCSAWMKYNDSFDWQGWRSSVSLSPVRSRWPQLVDYQVDRATRDAYDTILNDVVRASRPDEPVFTFMSMPMFNWITGRPQPTFCKVHYFDVCPDDVSEADAKRVNAVRPRVLVVMRMPPWMWRDQEWAFRGGKPSGQRSIQHVIDDLTSSGDYTLLHHFPAAWGAAIDVWARVEQPARVTAAAR